jgi:hypothetical protein
MFGHLPVRYQLTIWITGLVLFGGLGAWLATSPSIPVYWRAGALIGVVVGTVAIAAFTRLMSEPQPAERRS